MNHRPIPSVPPPDEAIAATAAAWLAERDGGLAPEDAAAFAAWRRADPRHEEAVARLEATWRGLQALREFRPEARVHPDRDLLARPARVVPFPTTLAATAALAACLALAAAAWWWAPTGANVPEFTARHATTVGGFQRVTLPDGSVVVLNANSEIRERFTAAERRVALVRGEATFQVAKQPARAFVVDADGVAVRAVGTAFNVRLQPGKVDVLVTEGRVRVETPEPAAGAAPAPVAELAEGQRVTVASARAAQVEAPVVRNVSPAIIREELSWQEPRLVFVETPLAEVVRQFNARNRVQIELADADLGDLPVGGSFRAEHVEAFVRLLVSDERIEAERAGPDRIVLRRAR